MPLQAIPGPKKRTKPLVVIAVLTRNRPEHLAKCLEGVRDGMKTTICDSRLMVWNNGTERIPEQTHGVGHNVGQHISMNRLIQEAADLRADYFIRVDDDCVFQTRNWLAKMVRLVLRHEKDYKRQCVISPFVHGLRFPPAALADLRMGKYLLHIVPILGGICRMMPMGHLRYWRFDERMPMGWSEATTYSKYCMLTKMMMLRCVNIEVAHGDPETEAHLRDETDNSYEREMLKMTPYGL